MKHMKSAWICTLLILSVLSATLTACDDPFGKDSDITRYTDKMEADTPLSINLTRSDKANEDWLYCYVEDFEQSFTRFSIMHAEEDLGVTDGTVYTHMYRLSEMPYRIGTYVLENATYRNYASNSLVIDGLYHHPDSPTAIEDSVWVYGTYTKQ